MTMTAPGEAPTYVNDSIPLGNDADETQQYVPAEELLNTPFMKEALFKEDKAQEEAKSKAVNEARKEETLYSHFPRHIPPVFFRGNRIYKFFPKYIYMYIYKYVCSSIYIYT